ncbi:MULTISPECIES: hypothetical protein [Deefgea]|uniref:Uncharacterized protein n=1 Tax=Deefgea chitinilytica TaxID=570276 RepID=A0ABS2CAU4_9NEIS|nr:MULTISPECIES: hypothetical protein [Deefgea]MBM5571271.1 hypothetical protein [Deefgea chitinilytica]MBM9888503.1 hypothetical protein [Deefgea sp. CFH1-16]
MPLCFLSYFHATNAVEVIAALKKWRMRSVQLQNVIVQALLLYWMVWSLLGLLIWHRMENPTLLVLFNLVQLNVLLMGYFVPQALDKKALSLLNAPVLQGQGIWAVLIPTFALIFFPQYEVLISNMLLAATLGLLLALAWQLRRFGRARHLANIKHAEHHSSEIFQQTKHPLLLRLEMNMGGALDQKGQRKILVSLFLFPYTFILGLQHLVPASLATSQWGAGACFAMLIPGFLGLFTGRRQWPGAWLIRSHSRAQLWWQDEQLFLGALLVTAVLNGALLRLLQVDNVNNILNAALLFVFGGVSLRYLIFSMPWMSLWGLSADGRTTQVGLMTLICLMPLCIGVTTIWNSGVQSNTTMMIMAFALAAPILAYVSYRKAMKIDLGAIRRAKRS